MAGCVLSIFVDLYPRVMVSSTSPAFDLTVHNTASGSYPLTVMTVVAAIFLPFVLCYQAWSYYVFRRRVSRRQFPEPEAGAPTAVTRSRSG
jgi:cytochrome d ubiquinol oxidase subunit II